MPEPSSGSPDRPWSHVREQLDARPADELTADDLERLADAAFWTDDHDRSIEVRRDAYRAHVSDADPARAALAAWRLFYDHALIGEMAPALGWLERARRHGVDAGDERAAAWIALADADLALGDGDVDRALELASRARSTAADTGDADLAAMALQAEGRALIAAGDRVAGCGRLDEAMVAVINDELDPMYTGWVFCNVVAACYAIADIRRATEWSDAAMRWCTELREGRMYPGLCRVYSVELAYLRGKWNQALSDAESACEQLTSFEPRYAGAAFGLVGDLRRVRGDLDGATEAYRRSHELGAHPQPGLALLHCARGDFDTALRSLTASPRRSSSEPLPRAFLLVGLAEIALAADDDGVAIDALGELADIGDGTAGLLDALALTARAELAAMDGRPEDAIGSLRQAIDRLHDMGFPYETARRRVRLAELARAAGDEASADLELATARTSFEELDARLDLAAVERLRTRSAGAHADDAIELTPREQEVLSLVARGHTNNEVASALVLSPHTVARHMTNIRTKLGVTSRAAAVAAATDRGWSPARAAPARDGV